MSGIASPILAPAGYSVPSQSAPSISSPCTSWIQEALLHSSLLCSVCCLHTARSYPCPLSYGLFRCDSGLFHSLSLYALLWSEFLDEPVDSRVPYKESVVLASLAQFAVKFKVGNDGHKTNKGLSFNSCTKEASDQCDPKARQHLSTCYYGWFFTKNMQNPGGKQPQKPTTVFWSHISDLQWACG